MCEHAGRLAEHDAGERARVSPEVHARGRGEPEVRARSPCPECSPQPRVMKCGPLTSPDTRMSA
eukprot:6292281-Alexandrium_andersonii.AAC.1